MGFDRTDATADNPNEAAEEPPPPDRRPPADRPGAEGAPSRADSRNGAAAANDLSSQTAETRSEEKPASPEASQETTDGEDNTAVENKPETSGTSESNEDLSDDDGTAERLSNPSQESLGATSDTTRSSDGINGAEDADRRNQSLDDQTAPHDTTMPSETDMQAVPPDATERTENKGAGETSATDVNSSASATDIGENPGSAPNPDASPLAARSDVQEPSADSLDALSDVVGDDERGVTLPADAAAEIAAPSAAEDQPESTDKPPLHRQVDLLSTAGSDAEAHEGGEQADNQSDSTEDRSEEMLEGEAAAANTDNASRSGAETLTGRLELLDDADPGTADQRPAEATGTANEEQQGSEVEPTTPQPTSTSELTEATWATGGLDIAGDGSV